MTRREFTDKHKHELFGLLLDAALTRRTGADLSLMLSQQQAKVLALLGQIYDDLMPSNALKGDDAKPTLPLRSAK